jgi:hypothetical protein
MKRLVTVSAALVISVVFAIDAGAERPNRTNRFEARFVETPVSVTNRLADLGILQVITTGPGTVEGFGSANVVVSITMDHAAQPCGPGSVSNAATRRIVANGGMLAIRETAITCPTPTGHLVTGTFKIDGAASTGVFEDASGSGSLKIDASNGVSELSGKLKLAGGDDH